MIRKFQTWALTIGRYFLQISKRLDQRKGNDVPMQEELVQDNAGQGDAETGKLPGLGKLTPISNATNIEMYESELISKLADPDVRNIAICGPYGSGKSTIIKTFFLNHPEFNPLYVSLAAFKNDMQPKNGLEEDDDINQQSTTSGSSFKDEEPSISDKQQKVLDDRIEFSILQQLFYHVRGKDVPYSRLKRIRTIKKSMIASFAILVTVFVISVFFIYKPSWLPGYEIWYSQLPKGKWLIYLAITAIVLGATYLVYLSLKFRQTASVIKLNLDMAELEIAPDKGASVLNQHMDEIVYYFGATRHDLLVIEDLDRFKNQEIFVKLREINTLINNSLQINRKVTFIYALRDDLFIDESRIKFFDLILPVIPVTNAGNSASRLINLFEKLELKKRISRNLLSDLSLFITDRRLIQNIYNEFLVYYQQLNNSELLPDILLAMIVYKNLHPTDFSDLQHNKGMLYEFLQRKQEIIEKIAQEKENQITELEVELNKVESEKLLSLEELKILYLGAFYARIYKERGDPFTGRLYVGDRYHNFNEILEDSIFNKLQNEPRIQYTSTNGIGSTFVTFDTIEKSLSTDLTYIDRKESIIKKIDGKLTRIKRDLNLLNNELRLIKGKSIKEILIDKKLSTLETPINNHKALAYLVGRGYISEDYLFYVSYFQPGQLTEQDFKFILAIKNRTNLTSDHNLLHINHVIDRLDDSDYRLPEVLNYDLVNYMILASPAYDQKLSLILGQMETLQNTHWQYLEGFAKKFSSSINSLISRLIKIAPNFWLFVKQYSHNEPDYLRKYLILIIESGDVEAISKFNDVQQFISDFADSSFLMEPSLNYLSNNIFQALKTFNIKFRIPPEIDIDSNGNVFRYVWDNNHYGLNREMVDYMLAQCYPGEDTTAFEEGQLTRIMNGAIPYLSEYAQANLDEYIRYVFLRRSNHQKESKATIMKLMTLPVITAETRQMMIAQVNFKIDKLDEISSDIYDFLLTFNRIIPTWRNIVLCLQEGKHIELTPDITEFLAFENNYRKLAEDIIDQYDEVAQIGYREILVQLLQGDGIKIDHKLALLSSTTKYLTFTSFTSVGDPVIKQLVKKNLISPDEITLKALKDVNFPDFSVLLRDHWSETLEFIESLELNNSQYSSILSNLSTSSKQKIDLYISMTPETLLHFLLRGFRIPEEVLRVDKFLMNISQLQGLAGKIQNPGTVVGLIAANIDTFTEKLVIEHLKPLGSPYSKIASQQGKELPKSDQIIRLLQVLEEAGFLIAKFEEKAKIVQVSYSNE